MLILFWFLILAISLFCVVKAAGFLIKSSEKIGIHLRIPPFIIGITIVALGTSLPELATSLVAVWKGSTEIVAANVLGSNIANIFLVIGLCAIFAHRLTFLRELIDIDAPLVLLSAFLGGIILFDQKVTLPEALILVFGLLIYIVYSLTERRDREKATPSNYKELFKSLFVLVVSAGILAVSANFVIDSILNLAGLLNIATSLLVISAVALGTSLPELVVSTAGILRKKYEIAIGNILGSCVFNILGVLGISGLFKTLIVDEPTLTLALPFSILASLIITISVISKKIHIWEGMLYVLIYIVFIAKLINIF